MNMNTFPEQQLTDDIMRRVRFIHGVRMLMSPGMIRAAVFLASVVATIALVSVPHVISNMSHLAVNAYAAYLADAYVHTSLGVQVALVLASAAALWFVADIVRNARYSRMVFRSA